MTPLERSPKPYEPAVRRFPRARYKTVEPYLPPLFPTLILNEDKTRGSDTDYVGSIEILDIGGFRDNATLRALFPGITSISLNIPKEDHDRKGHITYNGETIPFAQASIPAVIAVDVIEQVDPDKRFELLREMVRVASERVIISSPFHSEANIGYEDEIIRIMEEKDIPPKLSLSKHKIYGLPQIEEFVAIARKLRLPFHLHPATDAANEFQGLRAQIETIIAHKEIGLFIAKELAKALDQQQIIAQRPTWQQAYRAVLVIDKHGEGRIVTKEEELALSLSEITAYSHALQQAGWGYIEDPITFYQENPLRGRHIAFEGPDGSGKTTIMREVAKRLAAWGYKIAMPKDFGLRADLRSTEAQKGKLIEEPAREAILAAATVMATIDANAHTLKGPCYIGLSERTLASVDIHHAIHGEQQPVTLMLGRAPQIPPDLTFVFEIDDLEENYQRMNAHRDLANAEITREQLQQQRELYQQLPEKSNYTGPICRIKTNGPIEETVERVLQEIERHCGIPTTRPGS